jgi:hypothetical protein
MAKRILIGNEFYRVRRGVLVKIPDEWLGKTTHPQTIRKRKERSKLKDKN